MKVQQKQSVDIQRFSEQVANLGVLIGENWTLQQNEITHDAVVVDKKGAEIFRSPTYADMDLFLRGIRWIAERYVVIR